MAIAACPFSSALLAQRIRPWVLALGPPGLAINDVQQVRQIAGVLFLVLEYVLDHHSRGGIVVAEVTDHLLVDLDDDSLGDEVLADHLSQGLTFDVLRNGPLKQ